jgi:hypothetical protein
MAYESSGFLGDKGSQVQILSLRPILFFVLGRCFRHGVTPVSKNFSTEQEAFWAGQFGDEYVARNVSHHFVAANIAFSPR